MTLNLFETYMQISLEDFVSLHQNSLLQATQVVRALRDLC